MRSILFIVNPIAGSSPKQEIEGIARKRINPEELLCRFAYTEYAGHAYTLAAQAVKEECQTVVAVGGDGTINEVARALVHSQTELGIIACGSGNGLARHLMLPKEAKRALQIILNGESSLVDYGIINGHHFFCTCGMGFDALVSKKFAQAGRRGFLTYIDSVVKEFKSYVPENYRIEADGVEVINEKAFLLSFANASQYGNNAYIAPHALISDGLLDMILMEPFDFIEASQISLELFNKTLNKHTKIKSLQGKEFTVYREKEGLIHIDGDALQTSARVDIKIVPKGLRVIINPSADRSHRHPNFLQHATSNLFRSFNTLRSHLHKK